MIYLHFFEPIDLSLSFLKCFVAYPIIFYYLGMRESFINIIEVALNKTSEYKSIG